jgi:uncharacterized RDD family membrane protein YckC
MIYDALLLVALLFIAGFAFIYAANFPQHPGLLPIFRLYLLAIIAAYFCWFWSKSGQTLAMKTWRIKLQNGDGNLITPLQALMRFAFALVGICLGGITILWALVDHEKQFLHDRLIGSRLLAVATQ